jgi:hypothetical protein
MPTTITRMLTMSIVLETRSVVPYLVYVTVFRYMLLPCESAPSERIRELYGRDTTGGLAYNHPTRCLTSYGDGKVVWSASRPPQPAP